MTRRIKIDITPSEAQYRQLSQDLEYLRSTGAASNTAAIVEAVRQEANRLRAKPTRRPA